MDKSLIEIMRLQITLQALGSYGYTLQYHHKLQGFIYNMLIGTPYERLHDEKCYKFFCFSNILPPTDMKEEDLRTLIISSPNVQLIYLLQNKLNELKSHARNIGIGDYFFRIKVIRVLTLTIEKNCSLITGTPIIIRIPNRNYEQYGIESKYEYVFWRAKWPFEAFVKQVEENLIKKFIMFNALSKEEAKTFEERTMPLFQQFVFKKEVCNHLIFDGKEEKVFGSLWQFHFQHLNQEQQILLQFGFDTGFGEKNSYGFGFINLDKNRIKTK